MKHFLLRFFTWWNGATLNTLWHTRRHGELVGHDESGNTYYRTRGGKMDPALGFERRWVIYNGLSEASTTPPGWNGWLHHTVDTPPTRRRLQAARMGAAAYGQSHRERRRRSPKGSTLRRGQRQASTGDYQAWTPGGLSAAPSFRPALPSRGARCDGARDIQHAAGPNPDDERTIPGDGRGRLPARRRFGRQQAPPGPTRSSIRPRSSRASTRSPGESSPSRWRSTKRCSSARCRSRRASAIRARRPRRRAPTSSPRSTRSTENKHTHRIFTGWMFADSPGMHGIEHPVYDIWLTDCKGGTQIIHEAPDVADCPLRLGRRGPRPDHADRQTDAVADAESHSEEAQGRRGRSRAHST